MASCNGLPTCCAALRGAPPLSQAYNSVVETMKLPDGHILGLPIVMDTDDESVQVGQRLLLQFAGTPMALMTVESKWQPDKARPSRADPPFFCMLFN